MDSLARMRTMTKTCIDAHHHLWRYQPEEYPWMGKGMEVLVATTWPPSLKSDAGGGGYR